MKRRVLRGISGIVILLIVCVAVCTTLVAGDGEGGGWGGGYMTAGGDNSGGRTVSGGGSSYSPPTGIAPHIIAVVKDGTIQWLDDNNQPGNAVCSTSPSQVPITWDPHILDTKKNIEIEPVSHGGSGGSGGFSPLNGFGSGAGFTPWLNPEGSGGSGGFNPLNDPGSGAGNNQGSLAPSRLPVNDFQLQDSPAPGLPGGAGIFNPKTGPGRGGLISDSDFPIYDYVNNEALNEALDRGATNTAMQMAATFYDLYMPPSSDIDTPQAEFFEQGDIGTTINYQNGDSLFIPASISDPFGIEQGGQMTFVPANQYNSGTSSQSSSSTTNTGGRPDTKNYDKNDEGTLMAGDVGSGNIGYETPDMPGGPITPTTFDTYYVSRILKSGNLVSNPNPEGGGGHDANVILPTGFGWTDPNPEGAGRANSGVMTPLKSLLIDPVFS